MTVVGKIMAPQRCPQPIIYTFHDKMNFADVMNIKGLEM